MKKIVYSKEGLCNRLRVIFTWRAMETSPWAFVWTPHIECPARFDELFQPIPGVEMIAADKPGHVDVKGWHAHPKWSDNGTFLYDGLLPSEAVAIEAKRQIDELGGPGNYLSIHFRSTDLANRANTKPETQINFLNDCPRNLPIWLATDCKQSQEIFKKEFGSRIVCREIVPSKALRQTTVQEALADIYACMMARHHAGMWQSSFSAFIVHNRHRTTWRKRLEILGF